MFVWVRVSNICCDIIRLGNLFMLFSMFFGNISILLIMFVSWFSVKLRVMVVFGLMLCLMDECEILCLCYRVMFFIVGIMVIWIRWVRLVRFLVSIGFFLCGIVDEFFWFIEKNFVFLRILVCCMWWILIVMFLIDDVIIFSMVKNIVWWLCGIIWVEIGLGFRFSCL